MLHPACRGKPRSPAGANRSIPQFWPGSLHAHDWCRRARNGVDGCRKILIRCKFQATGLEKKITPDLAIDFIGPYQPTTFKFDGEVKGVKPADLAGFESPIVPKGK